MLTPKLLDTQMQVALKTGWIFFSFQTLFLSYFHIRRLLIPNEQWAYSSSKRLYHANIQLRGPRTTLNMPAQTSGANFGSSDCDTNNSNKYLFFIHPQTQAVVAFLSNTYHSFSTPRTPKKNPSL